ncbi:hypothetical protein [Micromonospora sp. NPDC049679]|uniref:hypothetical protein n=1 Tax=Micromonospora sp. NPDC049679 TaxID=3155920 RepID=UPI0033EE2044
MMVTARKLVDGPGEVRYEFGFDRDFNRVLVIDKETWEVRAEDGNFDAAAGAISSKIKKAWRESGDFPPGALFAS